eukprot:858516-Amphidinium_carterae.1
MSWFERVPSASNVADDPSRLRPFVAPQGWESTEVEVVWFVVGRGSPFPQVLGCVTTCVAGVALEVFPSFCPSVGLSGRCGLDGVSLPGCHVFLHRGRGDPRLGPILVGPSMPHALLAALRKSVRAIS